MDTKKTTKLSVFFLDYKSEDQLKAERGTPEGKYPATPRVRCAACGAVTPVDRLPGPPVHAPWLVERERREQFRRQAEKEFPVPEDVMAAREAATEAQSAYETARAEQGQLLEKLSGARGEVRINARGEFEAENRDEQLLREQEALQAEAQALVDEAGLRLTETRGTLRRLEGRRQRLVNARTEELSQADARVRAGLPPAGSGNGHGNGGVSIRKRLKEVLSR